MVNGSLRHKDKLIWNNHFEDTLQVKCLYLEKQKQKKTENRGLTGRKSLLTRTAFKHGFRVRKIKFQS